MSKINYVEKGIEPIKCLSLYYFSNSNAFAFAEDLRNQIISAIFNHKYYI